jgi:hypothetical protein
VFQVRGTDQALFGLSREAVEGKLAFSPAEKLDYRFALSPGLTPPASMVIEYSFSLPPDAGAAGLRPLVDLGGYSWILPTEDDLRNIIHGDMARDAVYHYAIPVHDHFSGQFSITLTGGVNEKQPVKSAAYGLQIRSIEFTKRWFGFYRSQDASGDHVFASPFVSGRADGSAWQIEPHAAFTAPEGFFPVLSAALKPLGDLPPGSETVVEAGGRRFGFSPRLNQITIPAGMITHNDNPLTISGDRIASFSLGYGQIPPFPAPIAADPGLVLAWPQERWRDRRYEVFRWDQFPSLLIFDFADYAVQDHMLKRLAFFVEKTGYRGRLVGDEEIAGLYGWNAHDYKADDLARFYQLARESNFPLTAEEREMEQILLTAGIIRNSGAAIQEGEGGIISISRESADYLRVRFMVHEGFHGLFFIDDDFRAFCRRRWQQFPAEARRFIISFFDYQRYDTADEYLLVNEFMGHILQQPVSQAGYYFGQALPARIEEIPWRRVHLPTKDITSDSWPSLAAIFTREAEAFSAYVGSRWGFAAGRTFLVTVRQP